MISSRSTISPSPGYPQRESSARGTKVELSAMSPYPSSMFGNDGKFWPNFNVVGNDINKDRQAEKLAFDDLRKAAIWHINLKI